MDTPFRVRIEPGYAADVEGLRLADSTYVVSSSDIALVLTAVKEGLVAATFGGGNCEEPRSLSILIEREPGA